MVLPPTLEQDMLCAILESVSTCVTTSAQTPSFSMAGSLRDISRTESTCYYHLSMCYGPNVPVFA